jgi:formylglycine-generating enzyme required for sulfatase activity
MAARVASPVSVFDKVLHAFETGDLAYSDVLEQLQRVLASGAAPRDLSEILRRRELISPLPPSAHRGILAALDEAIERPAVTATPDIVALEPDAPIAPIAQIAPVAPVAPIAAVPPSTVFDKVLDTFETGGFTFADVLDQLQRLLGAGASPSSLLAALRRRELIDPLPQYAHVEIMGRLHNAIQHSETSTELAAVAAPTLQPSGESAAAERAAAAERSAAAERAVAAERLRAKAEATREAEREAQRHEAQLRALREAIKGREAQLVALQREHAKVVPALEVRAQATAQLELEVQGLRARAQGLAVDLEDARGALEAERAKARAAGAALTERIAASEQEQRRELQAARDAERRQTEARAAELAARDARLAERDAQAGDLSARLTELDAQLGDLSARLAERDAQLQGVSSRLAERDAQLQSVSARLAQRDAQLEDLSARLAERAAELADLGARLAERDAQLGTLRREHAGLVAALEMRTRGAAAAEVERQAARERTVALTSELAAARDALDAERGRSGDLAAALTHAQGLLRERDAEIAALSAEQTDPIEDFSMASTRHPTHEPSVAVRVSGETPAASTAASASTASTASAVRQPTAGPRRSARRFSAAGRPLALGLAVLLGAGLLWFAMHRGDVPVPAPPRPAALPAAGTVIQDCATCPAMTVVAAGKFRQGSAHVEGASTFEQPLHAVLIRRPFALSRNTITVDEFGQFVAATQRDMRSCDTYDGGWKRVAEADWQSPGFPQTGTHPVTCVSWDDAERYAQWLSAKTGHHYRLPSASEWEYAAFAGGDAAQPWNSTRADACAHANVADRSAARRYPGWTAFPCDDGFVYTAPVGSFKANAFGLNDMLGNVFQWTEDCWHPDYRGAPIDGSARTDGDCAEHEMRGGSWFSNPGFVRANYRNHFAADYRTSTVGIRLVRDLEP